MEKRREEGGGGGGVRIFRTLDKAAFTMSTKREKGK